MGKGATQCSKAPPSVFRQTNQLGLRVAERVHLQGIGSDQTPTLPAEPAEQGANLGVALAW